MGSCYRAQKRANGILDYQLIAGLMPSERIFKMGDELNTSTDSETTQEAPKRGRKKSDEPKVNKDGFEAGKPVSPEDYFAHMAKLRQAEKKK